MVSERKKLQAYTGFYGNTCFWRTTGQAEIDYLEEQDGQITAYEFKWNPKAKARFPAAFVEEYNPPAASSSHVTPAFVKVSKYYYAKPFVWY